MPETRVEFLKTGVTFAPTPRVFHYDSDHFEPLRYCANTADIDWITKWNRSHKFLSISIADFEGIFNVIENLVKDLQDEPKLPRLLMTLPPESPPLTVITAIYEYWRSRDKVYSSAIKFREWPPEHADLRPKTTTLYRNLNKVRKGLSEGEYLKRLLEKLREMQLERKGAIESLQRQQEKQVEDERFVRKAMRTISKNTTVAMSALMLPPTPRRCDQVSAPQPPELVRATLPQPPTAPTFLKWCMRREDAE
jgi:hypothetical protein